MLCCLAAILSSIRALHFGVFVSEDRTRRTNESSLSSLLLPTSRPPSEFTLAFINSSIFYSKVSDKIHMHPVQITNDSHGAGGLVIMVPWGVGRRRSNEALSITDDCTITVLSNHDNERNKHSDIVYRLKTSHRLLNIAMLTDTSDADAMTKARNLSSSLLPLALSVQTSYWGGVVTSDCAYSKVISRRGRGKEVGITLAHYRIWKDFVRHPTRANEAEAAAVLVVLEADAICGVENCGQAMWSAVRQMSSDYMFLGWCDLPKPAAGPLTPPYCTHAYAVTVAGARALLDKVDLCGKAVDEQIKALMRVHLRGHIAWEKAPLGDHSNSSTASTPTHCPNPFGQGIFIQCSHKQ
jgi:hypothetical protein